MTLVANITREKLLGCLPEDATVAEIGVAAGDFSQAILDHGKASKLHLIDPWVFQDRADYRRDGTNSSEEAHHARYGHVMRRFAPEISSGKVVLHREFSEQALPCFDQHYFDWVYIDAMHTKQAVLDDLSLVWPKVKPDGFILGHDYTNGPQADVQGFGVVEAVNEFVAEKEGLFLAVTLEIFPSYVLSKRNNRSVIAFVEKLLLHSTGVVEIRGAPKKYRHKLFSIGDKLIPLPSF